METELSQEGPRSKTVIVGRNQVEEWEEMVVTSIIMEGAYKKKRGTGIMLNHTSCNTKRFQLGHQDNQTKEDEPFNTQPGVNNNIMYLKNLELCWKTCQRHAAMFLYSF